MKLVNLICPGCGATLNVDVEQKKATCPYCNKVFPVDDEVQHVRLDGAAQAGYEFEKGRQQAQAEFAARQQPQQVYVNVQQPVSPKKRRTWLWVLGWICIFPVPLTIIMLKNESVTQKLSPKARYIIIAVAWLLYLVIAFSGGGSGRSNEVESPSNSATPAVTQTASSSASKEAEKIAELSVVDETVVEKNGKITVSLTVRNDSEYAISRFEVWYRFEDEKGKQTPDRGAEGPAYEDSISDLAPGETKTLKCSGFDYGDSLPVYSFEVNGYSGSSETVKDLKVNLSGYMSREQSIEALQTARDAA